MSAAAAAYVFAALLSPVCHRFPSAASTIVFSADVRHRVLLLAVAPFLSRLLLLLLKCLFVS